ncbi:MAG: hypothetical protein QM729_21035 [Solirubrobacterales bacterium]
MKLSYADVTSTIALFLVLAGGSALAAGQVLSKNSVGTKQIRKGAVTGAKIKDGTVTGSKIALSTLGAVPAAIHAGDAEHAVSADHAAGADHATSADSAAGAADATSLGGVPAARYLTNDSVLGSGETEVGGWGTSAASGSYGTAVIDFKPKLGREIPAANLSWLPFESTSTNCPGPRQAAPGYLCVYTSFGNGMSFEGFRSAFTGSVTPAGPESVLMVFTSTASFGTSRGSWAYREP